MIKTPHCPANLPEVLVCQDGSIVTTVEEWENKRRPEILSMFQNEEYGVLPDMSDVEVSFRVADTRCNFHTMDSKAIRKTVEITAIRNGIHFSFEGVIFIPADAVKPVGCFLTVCNRGIKDGDPARHFLSPFWPAETIVSRGYAAAVILTQDIAPDYDEGFTTRFHKLFPEYVGETRPDNSWGAITAWSWGASRMMDYFEQDPMIDEKHVAVVGHSRGGKTALWTAAQDTRFDLSISSCAGNSGDALARQATGEHISDIVNRFPYWFAKNYQAYANHEDSMPFDQHMLISLIAPRRVYTTSKTFDKWATPINQFESLIQATPVYHLYGLKGMPAMEMPSHEKPIHDGEIAYHLKTGNHDMDEYDWERFLDYADQCWKE